MLEPLTLTTCFGSLNMFFLISLLIFSRSQSHTNGVINLQSCSVFFVQCKHKNDMHLIHISVDLLDFSFAFFKSGKFRSMLL